MSANHFHYTGYFVTPKDGELAKKKLHHLSLDEKIKTLDLSYLINEQLSLDEISVSDASIDIQLETGTSGDIDIDLLKKLKPLNVEFIKVHTYFDQVGESEDVFFFRGQPVEGSQLATLLTQFDPMHDFWTLLAEEEFGQVSRLMKNDHEFLTFVDKNSVLREIYDQNQLNLFNFVLELGADPNNLIDHETILQYIVEQQNVKDIAFIHSLLKHRANTNFEFSQGGSLLWHLFENHACLGKNLKKTLQLIPSKGAYSGDVWDNISVAIIHHDNEKALILLAHSPEDSDNIAALISDTVKSDNIDIYNHFRENYSDIINDDKLELFESAVYAGSVECGHALLSLIIDEIDLEDEFESITDTLSANPFATTLLNDWINKESQRVDCLEIDNIDAVNMAVKYHCDGNLQLLLNGKIKFTAQDSPLHDLVHELTPTSLELLATNGFSLQSENDDGHPFIEFAFEKLDPRNPVFDNLMTSFNDMPLEERIWLMLSTDNVVAFKVLYCELTDKNIVNDQGNSLLIQTVEAGAEYCFRYLCEKNPELEHKNTLGNSALSLAVISSNDAQVLALLQMGANANHRVCFLDKDEVDSDDETGDAMLSLLGMDAMSELARIQESIEDVLSLEGTDSSCLMLAACHGDLNICEMLLNHNAPVNYEDDEGDNALYYAVRNGHLDVFNFLVRSGANIKNDSQGDSLLISAVYHQHSRLIKPLVDAGVDINQKANDTEETPLCTAAAFGALCETDQVSILIGLGADINIPGASGNTPLIYCCENINASGAEALLQAGANINVINKDGKTAYDCYLANQNNFELKQPDRLKPTDITIAIKKVMTKIKNFIIGSLIPVIIVCAIITYFSKTWAAYFLYLVIAWWAVKVIIAIKKRFSAPKIPPEAPLAQIGNVLLNVMADVAEKEERKKNKIKQWEDD